MMRRVMSTLLLALAGVSCATTRADCPPSPTPQTCPRVVENGTACYVVDGVAWVYTLDVWPSHTPLTRPCEGHRLDKKKEPPRLDWCSENHWTLDVKKR